MIARSQDQRGSMTGAVALRALRAVAAVTAQGGVAGAAQVLHKAPSSVTRAVQGAESMLGVRLFDRGARGMTATQAAQVLAQRVTRALQALQLAADGLRTRGAHESVSALPRQASDALLQALVARAEHATESAAAAKLGLSQPGLHQALRQLEHLARLPLFERTRVGTRLDESGRWLLQQTRVALAEIRIGHEELARWRGQGGGQVAVGSLPMAADVLVPQALALALSRDDLLRLTVKDGTYEALIELLRSAEVDFLVGPLRGRNLAGDLQEEALFVDRFVAVVRTGHPLLRHGRGISLRRLAPYPWIGPLPGTPAAEVFDRLFSAAGLPRPTVSLCAHSTAVVRSVLLAGDHVALLSPLQMRADVQAGLLGHASAPLPGSERAIGITQRSGALASSACEEVMATLRQVAIEATAAGSL